MNIKEMIRQYAAMADTIAELENQMQHLVLAKKEAEEIQAQIKHELKHEMIGSGKRRAIIEGWKLNLSESTSTVIEAPDMIPEEYFKVIKSPDTMKIKDALKHGIQIEGAILRKNKNLTLNRAI